MLRDRTFMDAVTSRHRARQWDSGVPPSVKTFLNTEDTSTLTTLDGPTRYAGSGSAAELGVNRNAPTNT